MHCVSPWLRLRVCLTLTHEDMLIPHMFFNRSYAHFALNLGLFGRKCQFCDWNTYHAIAMVVRFFRPRAALSRVALRHFLNATFVQQRLIFVKTAILKLDSELE